MVIVKISCTERNTVGWKTLPRFIRSSFESIGTVSLDRRRNRGVCVSDVLNFPQLSIGFDSNITNGRSVARFFLRGRVFQPILIHSQSSTLHSRLQMMKAEWSQPSELTENYRRHSEITILKWNMNSVDRRRIETDWQKEVFRGKWSGNVGGWELKEGIFQDHSDKMA
jgi:hypothetical protein